MLTLDPSPHGRSGARVSKTEQETANQLDELRQWAQRKGFEVTRGACSR
jgi:hypothetical protein